MGYMFQIVETESQPALSVRRVVSVRDLPKIIGGVYGSILAYLGELGEQPLGPAFVAYYNMDMENLELEIGFPVSKVLEGKGDILSSQIPAGKKATTFFKGPYGKMSRVYEDLTKWINDRGYESTGVAYEFYYNSPEEVPESELLTQIEFLVE